MVAFQTASTHQKHPGIAHSNHRERCFQETMVFPLTTFHGRDTAKAEDVEFGSDATSMVLPPPVRARELSFVPLACSPPPELLSPDC
jgi:hypothetical protein